MLPEGSIKVEHLWKGFRGDRGRRLMRDQIERLIGRVRGKRRKGNWRWVLRDISFDIEPGESVGLVGINGSGKSTLLKMLAGVMYPHSGRMQVVGRTGALIEVTSGLHPDLTGRENVMIYGSLLGLPRKTVAARLDDIVAFAEVEDAVDRQVKYYSSGMKMRIGFSVAAFLDPRILLIDEVLAVGDASFQQKCLDRMRIVLEQGTTLVLVSHDLASVGATCRRGIWLADGGIAVDGPIEDVLESYRAAIEAHAEATPRMEGEVTLSNLEVAGPDGGPPVCNEPCVVSFDLKSAVARPAYVYLGVTEGAPTPIFVLRSDRTLPAGSTRYTITLPRLPLPAGTYYLWFGVHEPRKGALSPWQPAGRLSVSGMRLDRVPKAIVRLAPVYVEAHWRFE